MAVAGYEAGSLDGAIVATGPVFTHREIERQSVFLSVEVAVAVWFAGKFKIISGEHFLEWNKKFRHKQAFFCRCDFAYATSEEIAAFSGGDIFRSERFCPVLSSGFPAVDDDISQCIAAIFRKTVEQGAQEAVEMGFDALA